MIIIYTLLSFIGAYFIYYGIDTIVYNTQSIACMVLGGAYALGGLFLIAYIGADACDYYGWRR